MFRLPIQRRLAPRQLYLSSRAINHNARGTKQSLADEAESYGVPVRPTWSVADLLSSYSSPALSDSTLKQLHDLSALLPPQEGTPQHKELKHELEELVRLVEAVKLVDTQNVQPGEWGPKLGDGAESELSSGVPGVQAEPSGRALLKHASRTADDFYVVEADRHH